NLQAHVIKDLPINGPVLLPLEEDLPYLAKPFSDDEKREAQALSPQWNVEPEESYPTSFISSDPTMNDAHDNGMERAAKRFNTAVPETINRATITGSIQIGRNPGVVTATFLAPKQYLENTGLLELVQSRYE